MFINSTLHCLFFVTESFSSLWFEITDGFTLSLITLDFRSSIKEIFNVYVWI
jgi:hypothetical protein